MHRSRPLLRTPLLSSCLDPRRTRWATPVVAAALVVLGARPAPAGAQEVFRVEPLADGVWAGIVLPRPDAYAFANSLVVEGEEGILVVDTQQSPTAARALIRQIRARSDRPVRWVVNTHGHGDHVWGNVAYREAFPGVVFVGHADLDQELEGEGVERLREERERVDVVVEARLRALAEAERGAGDPAAGEEEIARLRWSLRVNRGYREDLVDLPLIPPDMEVEDPLTLDLGGREVRVLALGPAHTRTDAVVWLPEEEIVASGDLVEEGIPWFGDAHPRGWAEALGVLAALEPRILLPAHGGVQRDDEFLETERRFLGALVRRVEEAAARGLGLEEIRERVLLPGFRESFTAGDPSRAEAYREAVAGAVERAWLELEPALRDPRP